MTLKKGLVMVRTDTPIVPLAGAVFSAPPQPSKARAARQMTGERERMVEFPSTRNHDNKKHITNKSKIQKTNTALANYPLRAAKSWLRLSLASPKSIMHL